MKNNKLNLTLLTVALLAPLMATTSCSSGADINAILANMEKGFTMTGRVIQEMEMFQLLPNGTGVPMGEKMSQDYKVIAQYQNDENDFGASILHLGALGDIQTVIDDMHGFIDNDGYVYQEYVDYKNEVQKKYFDENGNKLTYAAAGLYNPASVLDASDFTYNKVIDTYEINVDKIGMILRDMLGHINSGFFYTPEFATLSITDNKFDTLTVKMEDYSTISVQNMMLVQTQYSNRVSFGFSEVGETKIEHVKSLPAKPENAELKSAFNKIGNNMTMSVESSISVDQGKANVFYRDFKFDGEKVLVHQYDDLSDKDNYTAKNHFILKKLEGSSADNLYCNVLNPETGEYVKDNHPLFAGIYQGSMYYEDILPTPSVISTDLFTYNRDTNEYECSETEIVNQIKPLLRVSKNPLQNKEAENAYKVGVRLDDNGDLAYIKFYVNYQDIFSGSLISGSIKETFSNVGSTRI